MENSENNPEIQNDVVYVLDFQGETLGTWFRTGEPGNRTYHVFDADQIEIAHVYRYRYVEGIFMQLVKQHLEGVFTALMDGPKLATEVEEFLAQEAGGKSDG